MFVLVSIFILVFVPKSVSMYLIVPMYFRVWDFGEAELNPVSPN